MKTLMIFSGLLAATSSMSMPPASLAMITILAVTRSGMMLRYSSFWICSPCSTRTLLTRRPSGPVWWVTSVMPMMSLASFFTSSAERASFTPPPLPRPPAWIWALTTTGQPPSPPAIFWASSTLNATPPAGTGIRYFLKSSLAWYSWIFMVQPFRTFRAFRAFGT